MGRNVEYQYAQTYVRNVLLYSDISSTKLMEVCILAQKVVHVIA